MPEATEIEKLVGELEIAVDRVRSLYEQYFMGIEKLEPTVPRKDVDRRIHVLRKEQIRNTAQRFRFQMVLQRYNTYQTHWMRICRQIENGTYKRHVQRANERFGNAQGGPRTRRSVRPPEPQALSRALADELAELDREFAPAEAMSDIDVEVVEVLEESVRGRSGGGSPAREARTGVQRTTAHTPPPPPRPSQPGAAWRKVDVEPKAPPPLPRSTRTPSLPPMRPPPRPSSKPPTGASPRPAPPASKLAPPAPKPVAAPLARSAPPAPKPAPPAAKPPPVAPPSVPALSEDRVRDIYAKYVDAKRQQNESTAAITYEAVARSLRDSSAKLSEKHGKAVDFEVAVKDGKAILKPVLK